ncbi:hypothetical protein [Thiomicrorhabdus cannonii]|uniref:hypothetical protein n=1 Tax=Thiomicrorhabdus cannonii TaxID=2748011 RepID=UPI0015B9494B|nr:hypothetical protein [Thiomicrorhabdus cannonii]
MRIFVFLLMFIATAASADSYKLWHEKDDHHWTMYPMMNPTDPNREQGADLTYNDDLVESVTEHCTWAKGELPVMIWGLRTIDSKTGKEQIFECAKYINPTN